MEVHNQVVVLASQGGLVQLGMATCQRVVVLPQVDRRCGDIPALPRLQGAALAECPCHHLCALDALCTARLQARARPSAGG